MNNPVIIGKATLYNMDCMELLKATPDKFYDLAIVDPPYGIGDFVNSLGKKHHKKIDWNNEIPTLEYFNEVDRVSKNKIVFGFNYYRDFVKDRGIIVHDKTGGGKRFNPKELSNVDIASHSFNNTMKIFHYTWIGNVQGNVLTEKYVVTNGFDIFFQNESVFELFESGQMVFGFIMELQTIRDEVDDRLLSA